jgi:alpha-L-fucosidase
VIPPKPRYFDVRTPEYTVFDTIQRTPWECVRGMDESFGHNRVSTEADFISQRDLLWSLVDITAKGGNLLLNVGPRGEDATIAGAQVRRLDWLSSFTHASGTALFGTRPWSRPMESSGSDADVRYTTRGDTVFAIARGTATTELVLSRVQSTSATQVTSAHGAILTHRAVEGGLVIALDAPLSHDVPTAYRIEGARA